MKEKILIIFMGTYFCTLLSTVTQETQYSSRTILKDLIRNLNAANKGISIAKKYGKYLLKQLNSVKEKETSPRVEDGYRLINNATDRNDITMDRQCIMDAPWTHRYCSNEEMLEIERHKLELCYNQTMNPSTQKTLFFGYPSKFLRELCVTHLRMYGSAEHHEECNGFQMILTMEASDGADKIKVISHEEMDDVEFEDEDNGGLITIVGSDGKPTQVPASSVGQGGDVIGGTTNSSLGGAEPVNCEWNAWFIPRCSKSCGNGIRQKTRTKSIIESNGGTCNGGSRKTEGCNEGKCTMASEPADAYVGKWKVSTTGLIWNCIKVAPAVLLCNDENDQEAELYVNGNEVRVQRKAQGRWLSRPKPVIGHVEGREILFEKFKMIKQGEANKPEDEGMNCCRGKNVSDECLGYCKRGNKTASSRLAAFGKCLPWFKIIRECKTGAVVDCQWNAWEPYSACSVACGEGTQTKTRTKSVEESGGGTCSGEYEKTISCYEGQCTSPGYTHKENYRCSNSGLIGSMGRHYRYSSFNKALNACNANSQCKCINHFRTVGRQYTTYTSGTLVPRSGYEAWVITAI